MFPKDIYSSGTANNSQKMAVWLRIGNRIKRLRTRRWKNGWLPMTIEVGRRAIIQFQGLWIRNIITRVYVCWSVYLGVSTSLFAQERFHFGLTSTSSFPFIPFGSLFIHLRYLCKSICVYLIILLFVCFSRFCCALHYPTQHSRFIPLEIQANNNRFFTQITISLD